MWLEAYATTDSACSDDDGIGPSATFVRLAARSEVHSEADISRITEPVTLMSARPSTIAFDTRPELCKQAVLLKGDTFNGLEAEFRERKPHRS